jgi:hypothetical protein
VTPQIESREEIARAEIADKAFARAERLTREVQRISHALTRTTRELAQERSNNPLRIPYRGEVGP